MKVKAKKGFFARHANPTFDYRFVSGKVYDIPEEHAKFLSPYIGNENYLEEVVEKKRKEKEGK